MPRQNLYQMKTILVLCNYLFVQAVCCAQSLQVFDEQHNNISGQTIDVWTDINDAGPYRDFMVKMIASTSKKIMAKRKVLSQVAGTDNLFCWAMCYGPTTDVSPTPMLMHTNDENLLSSHYFHYGNTGTTSVRYTLYDTLHPNDSVQFTVNWHITLVGIGEPEPANTLVSAPFPNPASGQLSFRMNASCELIIVNAGGQVMKNYAVHTTGETTTLDVSGCENGMYSVILTRNEKPIVSRKIIISH